MKKILLLAVFVLLVSSVVDAQQGWVNHKVDNKISIKFPSEPKEIVPGSFIVVSPDSSMVYIFTLVNFATVAGLDSAALVPIDKTPEFAAQLKSGMKQSLPNVDLADFAIDNYKGFVSYKTSGFDGKKKRYDLFMFIIGSNFYSLSTVTADGKPLDNRDKFFASVTLTQ